jgi:hypothetical protein
VAVVSPVVWAWVWVPPVAVPPVVIAVPPVVSA